MIAVLSAPDRRLLAERFLKGRRRSREFFDSLDPACYTDRPIPLRNPFVFYEGHLPAFNVNTLIKRGLGRNGLDEGHEILFARGIDPEDERNAPAGSSPWPRREEVLRYAARSDAEVLRVLDEEDLDRPALAEALFAILEHEPMHQETLRYMAHRVPIGRKQRAGGGGGAPVPGGEPPPPRRVRIPAGRATLGLDTGFGWDNELPAHTVDVKGFEIDVFDVTNRDYLAFVEAGGYERPEFWRDEDWEWRVGAGVTHPLFWERRDGRWSWRGMFDLVPLPPAWPVFVSGAEAFAFAAWRGGRLPTEAEYHRAAFGTPSGGERPFPWGDEPPDATRGCFDFAGSDPVPVGSHPRGASAWGVEDLVGNGWEWTSTPFAGFDGFRPMASYPDYSADFFDGKHFVLKGASPVTSRHLVRRSFRNWFRPNYPYLYASFRCVAS